jgi:soluble lytic murein transglycosylase-like protein
MGAMVVRWVALLLAAIGGVSAGAGMVELARAGRWQALLEEAGRRGERLPLDGGEAYAAAHAAGALGDARARQRYLELAAGAAPFADLARLELAELAVTEDPARAAELALPLMRAPARGELREAAVAVTVAALHAGLDPTLGLRVERALPALPRDLRRPLELALAASDGDGERRRLGQLLAASTGDQIALEAARLLELEPNLTAQERWWVAQARFRHALYDEAAPLLEALDQEGRGPAAGWEVAFLRGRCAFRIGAFEEAARWYGTAVARSRGGEQAAELEIHHARALELAGRTDEAVAAAQRAVRLHTTDDRRLFLARIRLRLDQPELAHQGISRVRERSARAEGELMLALHDLRHGRRAAALTRLDGIQRQPWSGPARVLAAGLVAADGRAREVAVRLEAAAPWLEPYWAGQARELLASQPAAELAAWRARRDAAVASGLGRERRRALAGWAALEGDAERLDELRRLVASETGLEVAGETPPFPPGLAGELWQWGLAAEAARRDPAGLPSRGASAAAWSAARFLELGLAEPALRAADAAWRMAGADIPTRAYPTAMRRALHPLPMPEAARAVATEHGVPWPLLAALAREESRWDPRAVSRVGARGLLQLMPATAAAVAARRGLPEPSPEQLFDPVLSLDLGAAELARLLAALGGNRAAAVAAYNAGEPQARLWLEECGPACTEPLYLAHVSLDSTRAYISDVLASAGDYQELYGNGSKVAGSGHEPGDLVPLGR